MNTRINIQKRLHPQLHILRIFENMKEKIFLKKDEIINESFVLYGSINFYDTNVEIDRLKVEKISSEDGLNIINSNFSIKNTF